jgi:adenine phosphoribosyltransferase|tara:strand:+ start:882 stop:1400 length:519 start_codon:yes stop_codon:yes gene_type:complete
MIKQYIKSYKDFPVEGVDFKCTASLCADPEGFMRTNNFFYSSLLKYCPVSKIIGLDARGFIFASVLAHRTKGPLVLARKVGKLPGPTVQRDFKLEYGTDTLEIQSTSIEKGDTVFIIDDLMATGGTVQACIDIVHELGGSVTAVACAMDLTFLGGSQRIKDQGINFYSGADF